ncbi:MAG: diaminopimelate epimerase [Burkholderiaceae bacterium]
MRLRFTKMHGAGNDFVVIDGVNQRVVLDLDDRRRLADRHFGVGADQILLVEASSEPGIDFRYRIFNSDGNEVESCGNGARCFVRFVREQGLSTKREIRVRTLGGVISPRWEGDGRVTVDMGVPVLDPAKIPFDTAGLIARREADADLWPIVHDGETHWGVVVSMGNPHVVFYVDDLDTAAVARIGPAIERSARFPRRVNVGFVQVVDSRDIRLRVWERGVGETLSCGTGACAAAVATIARGSTESPVRVRTRGGDLSIAWNASPAAAVLMTGPTQNVFEGEIEL